MPKARLSGGKCKRIGRIGGEWLFDLVVGDVGELDCVVDDAADAR